VSGDLAYTVGFEHSEVSVDGGPVEPNTLRVTHMSRRKDGESKIVHRHGDSIPERRVLDAGHDGAEHKGLLISRDG